MEEAVGHVEMGELLWGFGVEIGGGVDLGFLRLISEYLLGLEIRLRISMPWTRVMSSLLYMFTFLNVLYSNMFDKNV